MSEATTFQPHDAIPIDRVRRLPRGIGLWTRIALRLLKGIGKGTLVLETRTGSRFLIAGRAPGPHAHMRILKDRACRRAVLGGSVGFGEGYVDGDWTSDDPAALVAFMAINLDISTERFAPRTGHGLIDRLRHLVNRNTRSGSRRNIAFHYDLGNDFYRRWLDPSMTYSSAVFEHPDQSLEAAQIAKYRRLLDSLGTRPGQHLLEIGCGWGACAEIAARDYGLTVTGITLSREQQRHAEARIAAAGLADRVDIRLQDYRDVADSFDHVVSIEMFEAVGREYWADFFDMLARRVAPGGRAALQVITIEEARFEAYCRHPDFIQRYVFPGGMLPTRGHIDQLARTAGLRPIADDGFGQDYARTLAAWNGRFQAAWPAIRAHGFDDRFKRLWEFYLAYCEGGFAAGSIDVRQIVLDRP